jgi:hypothetical protein
MMLRTLLLSATLALVPLALPAQASHYECVTTSTGYEACGSATASCAGGTAAGNADGTVTWELVVSNSLGQSASRSLRAPAGTLAAALGCPIPGCITATLYADGTRVTQDALCQT